MIIQQQSVCNSKAVTVGIGLFILFVSACKHSPSGPSNPDPVRAVSVSVFPDIGTINTTFSFSVSMTLDGDTVDASGYQARWDWEGDGVFDTPWAEAASGTHYYGQLGKKSVAAQIRMPSGNLDSARSRVYVQELVQITQNENGTVQGNIDWSRDGTNRIAFSWHPNSTWRRIWSVEVPSGVPEQITSDSDTGVGSYNDWPEWSPDGKSIAFVTHWDTGSTTDVVVLDLSSGLASVLGGTNTTWESWSPDGRYVLSGDSLFDVTTHARTVIPFGLPFAATWSPGSDKLALGFSDYASGRETLRIVSFPGYAVIHEQDIPYARGFHWSADGKWIALGFVDPTSVFHVFNWETKRIYSGQVDSLIHCWWPVWSEDGSLMAFEAAHPTSGRKTEIWAMRFPQDME